jgi:hypothetical protein
MMPRLPAKSLCLVICLVVAPVRVSGADKSGPAVYVAGSLDPVPCISFTSNVQSANPDALVLLEDSLLAPYTRQFLEKCRPARVIAVGDFTDTIDDRLKVHADKTWKWNKNPPADVWDTLFPGADTVVVCPTSPRPMLLQAACLAVSLRAPLYLIDDDSRTELAQRLDRWHTKQVIAIGAAAGSCADLKNINASKLASENEILHACITALDKRGFIHSLVIANAADVSHDNGGMSILAPWIAGQRHAPLLLTNDYGNDIEERVADLLKDRRLRNLENVLLVGDLAAIPVKCRENPVPQGKDSVIEMEPLTPLGNEPYTFAVGRIFGDGPAGAAQVTMQIARQRLLDREPVSDSDSTARSVLVASNPGDGLPLLETFSRATTLQFQNAGYRTTTLFSKQLTRDKFRSEMPQHSIILWEGHHSTLVKDWGLPDWDEPLPSSLVMLQSCLALQEAKAQPLLRRGAVAVVGTSTRTFSGSGGAMSLAFFNAMLYDHQSVGTALRQAKNFMLAYSILKQRKLGEEAKRVGANQRAAWAFSLWGDPTLSLPAPPAPTDARPSVQHEVHGNTIVLHVPEQPLDRVQTAKYQVQIPANGRLAGMVRKDDDDNSQPLVPFLFAEVHLPKAPDGKQPVLKSKFPATRQVFCWDARRKSGYLLVEPHSLDDTELRFHITWEDTD